MSDTFTRSEIGKGVFFSSITDLKFKHNFISVHFVLPLDAATASDNAVVPFILRKGCRSCPDFTALNTKLCQLYGASLDAGVTKYNGYQVMDVSISGLDNRFALDREDIVGECAALLADVVLDPKLDKNGSFEEQDVALERQFLLDSIEAEINDKRTYALSQCIQVMCKGEPVAVRRYGTAETAKKVTPASAANAWRDMVRRGRVEIIFVGSGSPGGARDVFAKAFAGTQREPVEVSLIELKAKAGKVQEKTETMDVNQGKLVMGLRCGAPKTPDGITAMRMCSAVLGGTPFSKLFLNVREKLSLCYYCAARFDVSTKLLLIDSGVEDQNKEKARKEILRQLECIQKGEVSDEELANTKLLMRNSIITSGDSLSALSGWYMAQILRGQDLSPEQDAACLDAVTKEQVVEAAKAVTLDTVYFLTGNQSKKEAAQ